MEAGIARPQAAALGVEIAGRINELGAISETPEHLARIFLSKEHRAAADLIGVAAAIGGGLGVTPAVALT